MRIPYREVADLDAVAGWLRELGARTVVLDVEPLVAAWDTGATELRRGVDGAVEALAAVPGLEVVGFATNSRRRLAGAEPDDAFFFVTLAGKPLRTRRYRELPRPGVLVGDQLATDGLLAWRLGFAFAHVHRPHDRRPLGPWALRLIGRPLRRLLFRVRADLAESADRPSAGAVPSRLIRHSTGGGEAMTESGQPERRPQDPYVDRNRPDPAQRPASPRILQGLWGQSDRSGYRRLYFSRALDVYAEFRAEDVLETVDVGPDESPVPGEPATRVTVRGDALVDITRERRAESLSPFDIDLKIGGRITSVELANLSVQEPCILGGTPGDVICDSTQTCDTCFGQLTCPGGVSCDAECSFDCPPIERPASDLDPC